MTGLTVTRLLQTRSVQLHDYACGHPPAPHLRKLNVLTFIIWGTDYFDVTRPG